MAAKMLGIVVAEMFGNPPKPYRPWQAGLYVCDGCGCRVVSGWAQHPFADHFQTDFGELLKKNPVAVYWFERKMRGQY